MAASPEVTTSGNTPSLAKRWVFTINNWTPNDELLIKSMPTLFLIYGKEVGESGTPHLQGFCTFDKPQRFSAMKKRHPTAHWAIARGNSAQNITYCSKDGDVFQRGTPPADAHKAGARKGGAANLERLAAALQAARRGDFDAIPADLYSRYRHTYHMEAKAHMPMPQDLDYLPGIWIHGAAGLGKSRIARHLFPDAFKKLQNKWWDGYQPTIHSSVILDDFDFKDLSHHLKIWADRYAFTAEIKGGALSIRPKWFIITSNYSPSTLFGHDDLLIEAINRRFTVVELTSPWAPGRMVPFQLQKHLPRDVPQASDPGSEVIVDVDVLPVDDFGVCSTDLAHAARTAPLVPPSRHFDRLNSILGKRNAPDASSPRTLPPQPIRLRISASSDSDEEESPHSSQGTDF